MAELNLDLKIEKKDLLATVEAIETASKQTAKFVKDNIEVKAIHFENDFNVLGFASKINEAKEAFTEALTFLDKDEFKSIALRIGTIDLTVTTKE